MRLSRKMTYVLIISWCVVTFVVGRSLLQSRESGGVTSQDPRWLQHVTVKLVAERLRAFRAVMTNFAQQRVSSSNRVSDQMGVFQALALFRPQDSRSQVRWVDRSLQASQLPAARIISHLLDLPTGQISARTPFLLAGLTGEDGSSWMSLTVALNDQDYLTGFFSTTFLTSLTADLSSQTLGAWLQLGDRRLTPWSHLGGSSAADEYLVQVPGSNILIGASWNTPSAGAVTFSGATPGSVLAVLGLVAFLGSVSIFLFAALPTLRPSNETLQPEGPGFDLVEISKRQEQRVRWWLTQRTHPVIGACFGHLTLVRRWAESEALRKHVEVLQASLEELRSALGVQLEEPAFEEITLRDVLVRNAQNQGLTPATWAVVPTSRVATVDVLDLLPRLEGELGRKATDWQMRADESGAVEIFLPGVAELPEDLGKSLRGFCLSHGIELHLRTTELSLLFPPVRSVEMARVLADVQAASFVDESRGEDSHVAATEVTPVSVSGDTPVTAASGRRSQFRFRVRPPVVREVSV